MLEALACQLGRRDEVPNIELAEKIVSLKDEEMVRELILGVKGKDKDIANDCIKVLYEVGQREPMLIQKYASEFISLLLSKNNRLVWGAMTALAEIADLESQVLFEHLAVLRAAYEKGSVITRDQSITVFAKLCKGGAAYEKVIFPMLIEHLSHCRPKEIGQHAERMALCIHTGNKEAFINVLQSRKEYLTQAQKKRVEALISKIENAH